MQFFNGKSVRMESKVEPRLYLSFTPSLVCAAIALLNIYRIALPDVKYLIVKGSKYVISRDLLSRSLHIQFSNCPSHV